MVRPKPTTKKRSRSSTRRSASTARCTCGALDRAVADPEAPIVFDAKMNEFHVLLGSGRRRGHLIIRYCLWCGGAAPKSKRATFFAIITPRESERLQRLASGFSTVCEAIAKLGEPDSDMSVGMTTHAPETQSAAPTSTSNRTLTYKGLSKTADVVLLDQGPEHGLRVMLQGKYMDR
jgi:hypothetical protein